MSDLPIIGLHGAPRSGTTWIGQIFNSAPQVAFRFQPFFAHAFRPPGTSHTFGSGVSHVSAPSSPRRGMTLKRHSILPVFVS